MALCGEAVEPLGSGALLVEVHPEGQTLKTAVGSLFVFVTEVVISQVPAYHMDSTSETISPTKPFIPYVALGHSVLSQQ